MTLMHRLAFGAPTVLVIIAAMAHGSNAAPPVYHPVGLKEFEQTGQPPEELDLPYPKKDEAVILRSPYWILGGFQGEFSTENATVELYQLKRQSDHRVATLALRLYGSGKCVRGYEDWRRTAGAEGTSVKGLAWKVQVQQDHVLRKGNLVVLYQDIYQVKDITADGVQLKRITASCPAALRPLPECRPIPRYPDDFTPLFYAYEGQNIVYGGVRIDAIQTRDSESEATAIVTTRTPGQRALLKKGPPGEEAQAGDAQLSLKVGETLKIAGFQAYNVRRIVVPQEVNSDGQSLGNIAYGWIEIDTVPVSDEQGPSAYVENGNTQK